MKFRSACVPLLFLSVCVACTEAREYASSTDGGATLRPDASLSDAESSPDATLTEADTSLPLSPTDTATPPHLRDASATDSSLQSADGSVHIADGSAADSAANDSSVATDASSTTTADSSVDAADGSTEPDATPPPPACSPDDDPTCPCPAGENRVEYCADADRDGYCSENCGYWACPGNTNPNWLLEASCTADCEDTDDAIHPQAIDSCDGINDDCDNSVDEDFRTGECPFTGTFGDEGACFNAGTTSCEGHINCHAPTNVNIGKATPQASAAPNGSWDWDCDGRVETSIEAGAATGDQCNGSDNCQVVYRDEPSLLNHGCGQQVTLDPCQRDQNGQCVHAPASGGTQILLCH